LSCQYVLNTYLCPVFSTSVVFAAISDSGSQNEIVVAFGNIEAAVTASHDAVLKNAWKEVWDASANNQDTNLPMAYFVTLLGQRLIELKPKIGYPQYWYCLEVW
jgi:hypothetical protein